MVGKLFYHYLNMILNKKIIVLACALMLVGAGCTKTTKQTEALAKRKEAATQEAKVKSQQTVTTTSETETVTTTEEVRTLKTRAVESNLSAEEISEMERILSNKNTETGFKVYFPTFIPEKLKINEKSVAITDLGGARKIISYMLGDNSGSNKKWIAIQEQNDNAGSDPILLKEKGADYFNGYIETIKNDAGEFIVLTLIKEDKTFIKMTAKKEFIDADTLSKVAESM